MDRLSKQDRSDLMSRVRSKDTQPEIVVRRLLHGMGYRFRLHRADLPGKPDIVLSRWRAVVFIHGCFWHQHAGCPRTYRPATRVGFWDRKLAANVARDSANVAALDSLGWRVLTVWECETRDLRGLQRKLAAFLAGGKHAAAVTSRRAPQRR